MLASYFLGPTSVVTFDTLTLTNSLTISGLTASRLVSTDSNKLLSSVSNLQSWIAGTTNQINTADDGDGSITLSTPQDIALISSPEFRGLTIRDESGDIVLSVTGAEMYYTLEAVGGTAGTSMGLLLVWTYPS